MKTIDTGITVMNECYFRSRANKGCERMCMWVGGRGEVNTKVKRQISNTDKSINNNNDHILHA